MSKASRSGSKSSTRKVEVASASAFGIGIELDRPGAAHRLLVERQGVEIAAGALVVEHLVALRHAVRTLDLHASAAGR